MSFETNPQQVVGFPLLEISSLPDRGYGGYCGLFTVIASGLEDQAMIMLQGS
jgi:hypothetical protein